MPEYSVTKRTVSRREDGVELVRATFCYPTLPGCAVDTWVKNAARWVDETLFPHAKRVFENDPAADKRFSFRRFEYALVISAFSLSDGAVELHAKATLARARGALIAEKEIVERICAADGCFLPMKKKKAPRRVLKCSFNGVNQ